MKPIAVDPKATTRAEALVKQLHAGSTKRACRGTTDMNPPILPRWSDGCSPARTVAEFAVGQMAEQTDGEKAACGENFGIKE